MTALNSETLNFCPNCGGGVTPDQVTHRAHDAQGHYHIFDHVPALVCGRCGEYFLSQPTVERLESLVQRAQPVKTVVTAFYDYGAPAAAA